LKTLKTFLKESRTKISNLKHKDQTWKKKKRGHAWKIEKKEEKKGTIADNKSLINHYQVSHQEEKGVAMLLVKWWNNRFGYREVSYALSKRHMRLLWANTCCPHSYIFFIKKLIIKSKNSKTPSIFFVLPKKPM
jgi:hypothetical protein